MGNLSRTIAFQGDMIFSGNGHSTLLDLELKLVQRRLQGKIRPGTRTGVEFARASQEAAPIA